MKQKPLTKRCKGSHCLQLDYDYYKDHNLDPTDIRRLPNSGSFIPDEYEACDHCLIDYYKLVTFHGHCCCDDYGYTAESVIAALREAEKR